MAIYQFNMAREQVLTLEKRRLLFRWVLSYMALAAVAIAFVAHYLTVSVIDLSARRRMMDDRERRLLSQNPGIRSVDECLGKAAAELTSVKASQDAVTQFRSMGWQSADIVLGFAESLPSELDLGQLVLDGSEGTVKVEVYVPVTLKQNANLTLPNVISRWESSALLTSRVRQITSENSSRINFEGRDFLSWRFTGIMERNL